jgi:hypothetical protein
MNATLPYRLLALVLLLSAAGPARAEEDAAINGITAVNSRVSSDYVRVRLPDGKFKPEFYVFGPGGKWGGEIKDASADKLQFIDVARVIAGPLAGRNYLPAKDPAGTKLLIMVYWGTTSVPQPYDESFAYEHLQEAQSQISAAGSKPSDANLSQMSSALVMLDMDNHQRDLINFKNAAMLGYDEPGLVGTEKGSYVRGTAFGIDRDDLVTELEENRYFVVLMAYDFQILWKQKKHKLLWETRFSVNERHNQFNQALPYMAQNASQYFGQPSNGLVRNRVREGKVEVGDPTVIDFLASPPAK